VRGTRLYNGVRVTNHPSPHNVRRLDMGALPLVNEMHRWGIRVDIPKLESLSRELASLMESCEDKMRSLVGRHYANPRSPKQVSELLFHKLKVQGDDPVKLSPSGAPLKLPTWIS
jgi:DNA polymerase I-like protein with 3'-5' exonuclease and polymerase domains